MATDKIKILLKIASENNLNDLTIREVGRRMGDEYPQTVKYYWKKAFDAGKINYLPRSREAKSSINNYAHRNKLNSEVSLISIPIRGVANCGPATRYAQDEDLGYIHLSSTLLGTKKHEDLYAIVADGESMNKASVHGKSINDGDYVVVDRSAMQPKDNDYVIAIVNGLANIKRFYHEQDRIILASESTENYDPIFITPEDQSDSLIGGTVIQVVEKPKHL